jgi:tetratricopeptide (TPR) repeat protein
VAELQLALALNPEYAAARFNLAWVHLQRGDDAAYEGTLREAGTPLPAAWKAQLELVRRVRESGAEAAWAGFEAAPAGACGAPQDLDRLWLLVLRESWDEAEQQLSRIAARDADLPRAMQRAGLQVEGRADRAGLRLWGAVFAGNPQMAVLCRAVAELHRSDPEARLHDDLLAWSAVLSLDLASYWVAVGSHLELHGAEAEALDAMQRAVRADATSVEAHVALGYLLAAHGRPDEAIESLEVAVSHAPRWVDVRYQLALLYSEVEQVQAAEAQLRAALATRPDYVLARLALGFLLETQRRDAEALELLQSVRQCGIRSADLEIRLAVVHARLGHRNQARRARARARATSRGRGPLLSEGD